jgi:hypothetical protein
MSRFFAVFLVFQPMPGHYVFVILVQTSVRGGRLFLFRSSGHSLFGQR